MEHTGRDEERRTKEKNRDSSDGGCRASEWGPQQGKKTWGDAVEEGRGGEVAECRGSRVVREEWIRKKKKFGCSVSGATSRMECVCSVGFFLSLIEKQGDICGGES